MYLFCVVTVTFMALIVLYIFICHTLFNRNTWKSKYKTTDTREGVQYKSGQNRASSSEIISSIETVSSIVETPENSNLDVPQNGTEVGPKSVKTQHQLEKMRITIIVFFIVAIFILSYIPYLMLQILQFTTKLLENLSLTETIICNTIYWSFYINSMSNAIVYIFLDKQFRSEIVKIYAWQKCKPASIQN